MDRKIVELETLGKDYFGLRQIVRIGQSVYELMDVKDGCILHDGQKIAIEKRNETQIREIVSTYKERAEKAEAGFESKKAESEKLRAERNTATKAAEKARQEFHEYRKKQAERFSGADEDHSLLLDVQSYFDMAVAKLTTAGKRELSDENQGRFIGLCEYMYRALIQASHDARERFGAGWNMPEPGELLSLDEVAPNPRNLVTEFTQRKEPK